MKAFRAVASLTLIALAGCAGAPSRHQEAPVVEQGRSEQAPPAQGAAPTQAVSRPQLEPPPAPPPATGPAPSTSTGPAPTAGPAVIALLSLARSQAGKGEGEQAAATLERALRIEPQNAWVWHRLAVLRLEQQHWNQAIDLATKSITLAGGDPRLLGGNWEVIARARDGKGDHAGAKQAHQRAQSYFSQAH